jgi:hypothetical protein
MNKQTTQDQVVNRAKVSRQLKTDAIKIKVAKGKENAMKILSFVRGMNLSRDEALMAMAAAMLNIHLQLDDARKAALKAKVSQANWR